MEFTKQINANDYEIIIKGRFTFADRQAFKEVLNDIKENSISKLAINLSNIDFIDSAALGILLLVREEAEKNKIDVLLKYPTGQVQRMLEISNFYELFSIIDSLES